MYFNLKPALHCRESVSIANLNIHVQDDAKGNTICRTSKMDILFLALEWTNSHKIVNN